MTEDKINNLQRFLAAMSDEEFLDAFKEISELNSGTELNKPSLYILQEAYKRLDKALQVSDTLAFIQSHTVDEWIQQSSALETVIVALKQCPDVSDITKNRLRALKQDINSLVEALESN